jgi:lysophospholipase L1-like esterase
MKNKNMLYVVYICIILFLTIYLSLNIIQNKGIISGKFILPLEMNTSTITNENQPISINWNNLIKELSIYKTLANNESVRNVSLLINIEGFEDYNYSIEKPSNTFRIIALGDSFTEGVWISTNDTWPKQLERKLNQLNTSTRFEVLNFGKAAAGTLEEVKIFEENALKYNPDMVILLFYQNDFEDNEQIKKRTNELWNMYENGSFKFPTAVEEKIKELNSSKEDISALAWYLARKEFNAYAEQKGLQNVWKENVETPLIKLKDICKEQKKELVVIILEMWNDPSFSNRNELLNNSLTKYEIPSLDLTPYFPYKNNQLRLSDMHLSEKGYDLFSTKLLEFLLQSNKIRIK